MAWTTSGDAQGFHILIAKKNDGYRWRTAATLSEIGFDTDQWIGNACVTASGKRAVVVYAPRTFTNKEALAGRGGFTATVDLETGAVTKLPLRSSLAYFNPGCGDGESAVLTQEGHESLGKTRLHRLDAAAGTFRKPIEVAGQLTSAVPTHDGIVGADSGALVRVSASGERRVVTPTAGVPFRLAVDADGGVVFIERDQDRATVRRATAGSVNTIAGGNLEALDVTSGRAGRVFITGTTEFVAKSAPSVSVVAAPTGARLSTEGLLAVTSVRKTRQDDPRLPAEDPLAAQPVHVSAISLETGKQIELTATPGPSSWIGSVNDNVVHPALSGSRSSQRQAADPNNPADFADRVCSVPRNDPRNQTMQPKPRQVEWAVDQAVRGVLNIQRPTGWKNLGMPAYTPQGLFPSIPLSGGGYVPAQVMLGVAAQESNLWQAARFAIPGVTANPLIGNYYGIDYYNDTEADDWTINWPDADCGYGITQVTDGMRLAGKEKPGEVARPYNQQRAIALDFAANVAAGLQILQSKWNQTRDAGLVVNNGNPAKIENWFFAVWAYNSGFYPNSNNGSAWGVGWLNNPVNPRYPGNRLPFLEQTYEDAAHPQNWPYPEKVMGWAGHPLESLESPNTHVSGYRPAWWNGEAEVGKQNRRTVKPPVNQFCDSSNQCEFGAKHVPTAPEVVGEPAGPCAHKNAAGQLDLKCWYHQSSTWKPNCEYACGNELLRFDPGYAYQDDGTAYPPNCGLSGLPTGALIIDDVPDAVPSVRPNCGRPWTNAGTFTLSYPDDGSGHFPGKVDTHQIGGGFGGHFWFTHTRASSMENNRLSTTGTWRLNQELNGWSRVLVHLPDHGAHTQQAHYEVDLGNRMTKHRYLSQGTERNGWVSLGVYQFSGVPQVRLNSTTRDGQGEEDIAWDAIAFQPLPHKPANIVAALGDSYSSGEGAGNYYRESDNNHGTSHWNACRRSPNAWPRKMKLPGSTASLGSLSDNYDINNELSFVACSGAQTWNLIGEYTPQSWTEPAKYETGEGQFHEMSQIKSGTLDENTTLVTLSIGGNDNNAFAGAMTECAGLDDCSRDSNFLPKYRSIIDQTQTKIASTLRLISSTARNAKIVLISYPEPLSRTVKCAGSWYFNGTEADALAQLANYMATKAQETVARLHDNEKINASFTSPIDAFVGHSGCDTPEWVHKIVLGPHGNGDFHNGDKPSPFCLWEVLGGACLSRESFHPNSEGTTGYAQVMEQKLAQVGYRGR
ncbi:SGNH/GDSL hydrolase family protein [Amycolatopsis japonica]|uniref:SGNH/GDSL hydrolase family protein n=1 Tax=Amycolatopsis japonica TaxID=208439 RepID=UPI0033211036